MTTNKKCVELYCQVDNAATLYPQHPALLWLMRDTILSTLLEKSAKPAILYMDVAWASEPLTYRVQDENGDKLNDAVEGHVLEDREVSGESTAPLTHHLRHTLNVVDVGGEGCRHAGLCLGQGNAYMCCFQGLVKENHLLTYSCPGRELSGTNFMKWKGWQIAPARRGNRSKPGSKHRTKYCSEAHADTPLLKVFKL